MKTTFQICLLVFALTLGSQALRDSFSACDGQTKECRGIGGYCRPATFPLPPGCEIGFCLTKNCICCANIGTGGSCKNSRCSLQGKGYFCTKTPNSKACKKDPRLCYSKERDTSAQKHQTLKHVK